MNTLCFCPLIKKLQAFEIMKWAQGSKWRKQRTSNTTYIFTAVKYSFSYFHGYEIQLFKICIYLINIFLYFITLYIINGIISLPGAMESFH